MRRNVNSLRVGEELPPLRKLVSLEVSQAYSNWPEVSNLHTDVDKAMLAGYPGVIMEGSLGAAYVSELCLSVFGQGWVQGGRLEMRFVKPVFPPEVLTVRAIVAKMEPEGDATRVYLSVRVENERGDRVQTGSASGLLYARVSRTGAV